jgi:glucose/arabinose dehydrogenase
MPASWRRLALLLAVTLLALACSGPNTSRDELTPTVTQESLSDDFTQTPTATSEPAETATAARATASETPSETPSAPADATATPTNTPANPTQPPPLATATAPPAPAAVDLDSFTLGVEQVGAGFDQPDFVTHAGDGSGRIFVLEKTGSIRLLDGSVYLDITDQVLFYGVRTDEHELGLLGLAFHPNFAQNRTFYIHYTDLNQDHIIARLTEGADGRADPASETVLLSFPQPDINFVGGMLAFGPDGYLYIGTGTGTPDDPSQVAAQELDNFYGKILRIDVDGGDPYGIPPDNPFVSTPGALPEIWAYGLRNPFRFAFDRATNDLYIGEPGEFQRESIDFQAAATPAGRNFGWPIIEGSGCWEFAVMPCDLTGLELPIFERPTYGEENCVLISGYVYRGPSYPAMEGAFLHGDYCSGRIWATARDTSGQWQTAVMLDTDMSISSFGEDEAGDMYVCDIFNGIIYRVTAQSR